MNKYDIEAKERWGNTAAHHEYEKKTAGYSEDKWRQINDGLNAILFKFAEYKKSGHIAGSPETQALVKELQNYITENYYTCTNEILAGLGQMYVADGRFKTNIDKHASGTAEFISKAIKTYCN